MRQEKKGRLNIDLYLAMAKLSKGRPRALTVSFLKGFSSRNRISTVAVLIIRRWEYLDIIDKYKEKGYIMDRLLEYEVEMETAEEFYEPYYNTHRK